MKVKFVIFSIFVLASTFVISEENQNDSTNVPSWFKGKIGFTYKDSIPYWQPVVKAPKDAPNIVFIVLDDVGFGHISSFGGDVQTPNIDNVAMKGLRYTNFHTTALCSPTRSTYLTGRNHHSNGLGAITEIATGYPGYNGHMPFENGTIAEVLHENGYSTFAVGKWHLTPDEQTSQAGPFDRWPLSRGFDHFYGFMGGETDQWTPEIWRDNTRVSLVPKPNYHLSTDLVDQSMRYISDVVAVAPDRPFFLYLAFGAGHAPHQVAKEWSDKYKGKFDGGWDKAREGILARQISMGIVPPDTKLPPRNPGVAAWDTLSADQKNLYSRMNEVYAGFVSHADYEIGRLIAYLKDVNKIENTVIIVSVGDNGASQEGGPTGSVNENRFFNNIKEDLALNLEKLDVLGTEATYNHYPLGWAMAGNTPFKRWKQDASNEGGTRNPLIVYWPKKISDNGGIRAQFHHSIDLVPTLYEALGIEQPKTIKGYTQSPIEGISMAYTFNDPAAKGRHSVQYFEMFGSRAIYKDGWKALTWHKEGDDFKNDKWELYHIEKDWTETENLADKYPEKLKELIGLFDTEAKKYNVYPLDDRRHLRFLEEKPELFGKREVFVYYPGVSQIPETNAVNIKNRSFTIKAFVDNTKGGTDGVIVAHGGRFGGYSLYVKNDVPTFVYNYVDEKRFYITSSEKLPLAKAEIRFEFLKDDEKIGPGGTATLFVNNKKVGQGHIDATMGYRISFGEGLDIGQDTGSPVTEKYNAPFKYNNKLEKVIIEVGKSHLTPAGAMDY